MAPAADPKRLQIMQAAATALRAINGGSTYWYTVKAASVQLDVLTTLLNMPSTNLPGFVIEASPNSERVLEGGLVIKDAFDFIVLGRVDVDGSASGDKKVTAGEKLAHDVEVALAVDERLGMPSLVISARTQPAEVIYDAGTTNAVFVGTRVRCLYKRNYGQP